MAMVDVTVRGAGIFGLSVAWACVLRGASVRVVDPAGPAAGASGGIVGALAPHVPENWNAKKAFQLESLLSAEAFWAEVEAVGGRAPGYIRSGRLQPVADDAALALARQREDTAAELWQGRAQWELIRAEGSDWAPHSPTGWLIHDTLSALVHPRQACAALVAALAVRGVEIVAEAPEAGQTLWATGVAGLETLNAGHPRLVGAGIKGQAALLQLDRGGAAQLFADGVHVIPHLDGTVAVGGTTEREYDSPDSTDAQLDAVIAKARAAVPALQDAPVIERWAGLRPRSRSRAPMLGAWPGRPGQYIANGGFKIGFGMAPKVAEVMADLLLEGRDAIPEGFRVEDNL
ncbi:MULTISPECIES: NAD(P)/FAD-dependent oxidoreductase [unclassified Sulfitobacter]|jgi:glycine oxidase|uniref:NAD(P)/FAD-dependent oxidoreductase n=1 Tax=unclassified Sulfitobacter TaxID=196795 RepID=UPI00191BCAF5|nr:MULTISPECIES: FAD-binding oxidoreductase [unclassified Sulfitobacter]